MILDLFFLVVGTLFLIVFFYLFFLAIVSLWPQKREKILPPRIKFGIIIPAHNESELIGRTLDNLTRIDYPQNLYEVIVIADNCEDNTAEIVQNKGIRCWQRQDAENRGKGHVLRWAFPRLLASGNHEAYVVIDADTHMEKNFLKEINHRFLQGAKVVQGYSQARHPERSPMESLSFLGFALNRNLRYRGRSRLGWTTNLMGTGMCFLREVIEQYGWNTTSMVEDIEYEMFLHLQNIRVVFARDARISVELHGNAKQSQGQRTRWDMGKFEVRNKYLPKLLREGIRKRDISYFDSAMELILPPFSLFFIMVPACFCLYLMLSFREPDLNFYIWLAVLFSLILYTSIGLITARANFKVYCSLLYAPFFLVWRFWIIFLESCKKNKQRQW